MVWIYKMIEPIIKDCATPEEAEKKVIEWGQTVHTRDAFCGLMAVLYLEAHWNAFKNINPSRITE